jgi:hypothetical protein
MACVASPFSPFLWPTATGDEPVVAEKLATETFATEKVARETF